MMSTLSLFKVLINFSIPEFVELCQLICATIIAHTRSMCAICVLSRCPSKLSLEQGLFGFLLYLKHDPTMALPSFLWNWSKTSLISNQVFIASCVSWALRDEIKWPNVMERHALASIVRGFPGCIGIIDGMLVKIHRPWNNPDHGKWFNGCKKMYCMNNVVIVDNHGLFIYIDCRYLGLFHDVIYLHVS